MNYCNAIKGPERNPHKYREIPLLTLTFKVFNENIKI